MAKLPAPLNHLLWRHVVRSMMDPGQGRLLDRVVGSAKVLTVGVQQGKFRPEYPVGLLA